MTFEGKRLYMEFWDVPPDKEALWIDYYDKVIIESLRNVDKYAGSIVYRQTPPYGDMTTRVFGKHWGIRQMGLRTNFQVNLGALLQNEYTFIVLLFMEELNPDIMPQWFDGFKKVAADWKERYPGWEDEPGVEWLDAPYLAKYFEEGTNKADTKRVVDIMSRDFFSLANNHWDLSYDLVLSRFPIDASPPAAT